MERIADELIDSRTIGSVFLRLLPLFCLGLGGLCASIYVLMYPHHFAENCEFAVDTRELRVVNYSDLLSVNLGWLVPALPLIFLGHKSYVRVVYCFVGLLSLCAVLLIVPEDLTGYVNCYKRLGEGTMVIGLIQLLQAAVLLLFAFVVGVIALVRRSLAPPVDAL